MTSTTGITWSDEIDEILGGDLTAALGICTDGGGVVLATVAPIGLRDRDAGTVSFTTSLGFGRKLERIHANPNVALSYHTRQHGRTQRPGHVLINGTATIRLPTSEAERNDLRERAADHLGPLATGRFWDWWLDAYYQDRVIVDIAVQRVVYSPPGSTTPVVTGRAMPATTPYEQPPPGDATRARVPPRRVARSLRRSPHCLLSWTDADGDPVITPILDAERNGDSFICRPEMAPPAGGRRAGVLAHDFHPTVVGLRTATHTGWLHVDQNEIRWTPHTRHAFAVPPNKTIVLLANGAGARRGLRQAKQSRLAHRIGLEPSSLP